MRCCCRERQWPRIICRRLCILMAMKSVELAWPMPPMWSVAGLAAGDEVCCLNVFGQILDGVAHRLRAGGLRFYGARRCHDYLLATLDVQRQADRGASIRRYDAASGGWAGTVGRTMVDTSR